jgi:geranylgeranyl diphosphate synthase type II
MSGGLCAGQAWESETRVPLSAYHAAKTGALFVAATRAGAIAAGANPAAWNDLGLLLGEAYQIADDIRDVSATVNELGKPVGRDAALGRPSAVGSLGLDTARMRLDELLSRALAAIPACPGAGDLRLLIRRQIPALLAAARAPVAA